MFFSIIIFETPIIDLVPMESKNMEFIELTTTPERCIGLTKYDEVPIDKALVFDNVEPNATFHSRRCPLPFMMIFFNGDKKIGNLIVDKELDNIRLPRGTTKVIECAVDNVKRVAQIRRNLIPDQAQPPTPPLPDDLTMVAPELPEEVYAPKKQKIPKKKLPISEEFLPLTDKEWQEIWEVKNGKLTPPQAIAFAAENRLKVLMQYQKMSGTGDPEEGAVKVYTLEGYSYRTRFVKQRKQRKKYFFAWNALDNTIKQFAVSNIKGVQILPNKYDSGKDNLWPVEIKWRVKK